MVSHWPKREKRSSYKEKRSMTEEKVSLVITIYSSDDCTVLSSVVCGLFTWSLQHHRTSALGITTLLLGWTLLGWAE